MTVPDHAAQETYGAAADPLPAALLAIADHAEQLAAIGGQLDDLRSWQQALERRREGQADPAGYTPIPAPRWWQMAAADRTEAIDRLAALVEQVYATSYGHLAGMLADCWRQHDLCLFILDFVSELHSVLYLRPSRSARTLADQAELSLRILPTAAELMRAETTRCDHLLAQARRYPVPKVDKRGTGFGGAGGHSTTRRLPPTGDH